VFLVTDAMAVAGTDLGEFTLQGRRVLRREGRLTLEDGTLAGADCDMAQAVRVLVREVGAELPEALRMATAYPAEALGRADLGRLAPGGRADFVHLDDTLELREVWRAGERVRRERSHDATGSSSLT
jgi:N-acetylglucosamine-6-phosphate deacetylase